MAQAMTNRGGITKHHGKPTNLAANHPLAFDASTQLINFL
jgi:hypothetical protein